MVETLAPLHNGLRAWCLFLALFEIPNIRNVLSGAPLTGFQSRLADSNSTRRLWATFLSFLSFSRLVLVVNPRSRSIAYHNAAIHVVEAFFMVPESQLVKGGGEGAAINGVVIILNAVIFALDAIRRKKI
jgi:hypothetical protein